MLRESDLRNSAALVVSGNDEHGDPTIGNARERLERLPGNARRDARPIEHVAAVHDEIDLLLERRFQRGQIIREEVVAAPTSLHAGTRRQVEAEVGVGEEENPDGWRHSVKLAWCVRFHGPAAADGRVC